MLLPWQSQPDTEQVITYKEDKITIKTVLKLINEISPWYTEANIELFTKVQPWTTP